MGGDVISSWAWLVWIGLILVFVVIEMLSLDFTFLMIAVGSVGGLVSGLIGASWWLQIVVAAILSLLLLLLVRPPLHRRLHRGADPARSNVEALIGLPGTVVSVVDPHHGQAKLANGETWTVRSAELQLAPAQRVVVRAIDGATAVVEPADEVIVERPTGPVVLDADAVDPAPTDTTSTDMRGTAGRTAP